ncbi:MAG TPA: DUF4129 domain-containing protein [Candidatus Eremiobacteraceae bacterium]
MTYVRVFRALTLTCVLVSMWPPATATTAAARDDANQTGRAEAQALTTAASALDRAATARKFPAQVSDPQISPALGAWLSAGLATARKEKKASVRAADLRTLAASLRVGADLALRAPGPEPKNIVANVRQVLAEPAFRVTVSSNLAVAKKQSWLDALLQRFFDWWGTLMERAFSAAAGVPAIGNITAILLITAAALGLAFLAFRVTMLLVARRARGGGTSEDGTPLAVHAGAEETHDAARAAARDGAYGVAISLLFQAALLALDRSGRVPYDSARTAGEYRRAVRRSVAGAANSFEVLARAFTYAAYAQSPAGESDWRAADAAYASMSFTEAVTR